MKFLLTFTLAAFASSALLAAPSYRIERLPEPPNELFENTIPVLLNNRGTVVTVSGYYSETVISTLQGGNYSVIREALNTGPVDINDRGQIGINEEYYRGDFIQPWLYSNGTSKHLFPGFHGEYIAAQGFVGGINQAGHAVASIDSPEKPSRLIFFDGTESRYVDVDFGDVQTLRSGDLNDADTSVGQVIRPNGIRQAYMVKDGNLSYLDGFIDAMDINNAGQILGTVGSLASNRTALRDADGHLAFVDLSNDFLKLNERGWVSGNVSVGGVFHGAVFRGGRSWDLNSVMLPADKEQWVLGYSFDMNDRGQIVGLGTFDGQRAMYLATPVPETQTWALLICGLGTLGAVLRSRRQTAHP